MKDKLQALLDQIKHDFPNGCDAMNCNDCPLLTEDCDTLKRKVCDAVEWQCPHNDMYRQDQDP